VRLAYLSQVTRGKIRAKPWYKYNAHWIVFILIRVMASGDLLEHPDFKAHLGLAIKPDCPGDN